MRPGALAVLATIALLPHAAHAESPPADGTGDRVIVSDDFIAADQVEVVVPDDRRSIDLAILLDTSNSMGLLLEAARMNVWQIACDMAALEPAPHLRVALVTYGNSSNAPTSGWVRVETPLTEDLDAVSERLFALKTGGSAEYVTRALKVALSRLDWSDADDGMKMIVVAGNEPADQDPATDLAEVTQTARDAGIHLHALFYGADEHRDAFSWRRLAEWSGGEYTPLGATHHAHALVTTPFDERLVTLSAELNTTYVPLGEAGRAARDNQAAQDQNALGLGRTVAADRAQAKASGLYAAPWDLIESISSGRTTLDDVEEGELPDALRAMTPEDRATFVEEKVAERRELRARIDELARDRRRFLAERSASTLGSPDPFGASVRDALRRRAAESGFRASER